MILMKYITAILSGLFMFVCVGFLFGILLALICPKAWFGIELNLGLLSTNLPTLIAIVIAGLVATHTLRASLQGKTFRLYKKKSNKEDASNNQ
jgi:hypothetical protein